MSNKRTVTFELTDEQVKTLEDYKSFMHTTDLMGWFQFAPNDTIYKYKDDGATILVRIESDGGHYFEAGDEYEGWIDHKITCDDWRGVMADCNGCGMQ
tara:strand:- start:2518 stop:2811 length:294 start_codon:yes stop_codon:yes gene_type:complete